MTEDELNSLIAHAHRRIDQLQKQLAEQQVCLFIHYHIEFHNIFDLISLINVVYNLKACCVLSNKKIVCSQGIL